MQNTETFQLSMAAAEAYEARFVPALFAEWAPHLVELAGVAPGQAVLDVACGTGIVARTAADTLEGAGRVVGLDLNEAMLAVARRVRPDIEWRQGDAASLPFPDGSFDTVLCQMALMFFPDRARALRGDAAGRHRRRHRRRRGPGQPVRRSPPTGHSSRWPPGTPAPRPCPC